MSTSNNRCSLVVALSRSALKKSVHNPLFIIIFTVAVSALAQAHNEKTLDNNGGHYDGYSEYHCHESRCVRAPARYEYRRSTLSPPRDMELYYHSDDWPHWLSPNGTCQTSRTQVLIATSQVPVTYSNPRNCVVRTGRWIDPYTGEEFTRAAKLEIDHIISPIYANASNGYQWDYVTRATFANDPVNLIPVGRSTHRRKRSRGIHGWRPREEYLCEYAISWTALAEKYDLDLFARDRSRIGLIMDDCGFSRESEE